VVQVVVVVLEHKLEQVQLELLTKAMPVETQDKVLESVVAEVELLR
jgi:hypothetical protein